MEVVYKKKILDQVNDVSREADKKGKVIDYLVFSEREAAQLERELGIPPFFPPIVSDGLLKAGTILGIPFKIVKDEPIDTAEKKKV